MAVSSGRVLLPACLGALFACSGEPNFVDGPGGGADASGGASSSGGSGTGSSGTGSSGTGSSGTGSSGSGAADTGGGSTGGVGAQGSGGAPGGAGWQGVGGGVVPAVCGDGFIDAGFEECDDGNQGSNDGCTGCIVDCPADGYKDPVTFHCYFELPAESWYDAWQDCLGTSPGTDGAALSTLAEFDVVTAYFDGIGLDGQTWIGGAWDNGSWQWANGEQWIYDSDEDPWAAGYPQGFENCVRVQPSNSKREMKNDNCDENKPIICERKPLGN